MKLGLCAAVDEELGPLPGVGLGVGPVTAGSAAARWLATEKPDAVLLIGTAGAYAGGPEIGTLVAAGALGLGDSAAAIGLAYVPRAPGELAANLAILAESGLPVARVLTLAAITTDPTLAALHAANWEVEHMEAYAVALACAAAGVPFAAILGITNRVGPEAHAQWRANRERVQRAVQNVAARVLAAQARDAG